jgi:hypothetical protein
MCLARSKVRHPVFVAIAQIKESMSIVFMEYFYSIHKAKNFCENHHGEPITWWSNGRDQSTATVDSGHITYYIKKVEVKS